MKTYWHWLRDDRRLQFGSKELVEVGKTLKHDGEVKLCHYGFHASEKAIDALQYAPGSVICCVELGGQIIEGNDKVVAAERTVIWMADATNGLHEFSCWCAENALRTAKVEDVRCWQAIETKHRWLKGEASDAELAAARDAARDAAMDAARAAVWAAAWDAAWDAAWAAAWAAAWDAARDAARDAQNQRLTEMILELAPKDPQ